MPRLFTYIIPVDDGAAPNPFHGMCTLAICKPGIRRVAKQGDWIAGLGSRKAPSGDLSGRLVYAMQVEKVILLEEYDRLAPSQWPHRIPNLNSLALQDRLGDCIYDFSKGKPTQRPSVHDHSSVKTDLGGRNVLVSENFYYFGCNAKELPEHLMPICHQSQGHQSTKNDPYVEQFVNWLHTLAPKPGQLYGWPDFVIDWSKDGGCQACAIRVADDENDVEALS